MIANLTLIQTFYLVAHEGSFSAASRTLGISYQSLTNQVRRLEQTLGGQLIVSEKGGRNIELTSRGRTLYNLLHPELEAILNRLTSIINIERPLLRIGMPAAAVYFILPDVLSRLKKVYPDIEVQVMERDTKLQESIMDGSVDVCIGDTFYGNPTVPQRVLGKYNLILVYPSDWETLEEDANIRDWASKKALITYEAGQSVRNLTLDYLVGEGVNPEVSISTSSSVNICRCVERGLGYSIIPSWCLSHSNFDLQSHTLQNIPDMTLYFGYAQYLRKNIYVETLLKSCQDFFEEKAPQIQNVSPDNKPL